MRQSNNFPKEGSVTPDEMLEWLKKRQKKLAKVILLADKHLEHAPEGRVRVAIHKNGYQYYHVTDQKERNKKKSILLGAPGTIGRFDI